MNASRLWAKLSAVLLVAFVYTSSVNASIVGDEFFVDGTNFPIDFVGGGPLTFNATGDISSELAGGAVLVAEQFNDLGSGAGLLAFQAQLVTFPGLPFSPFGFTFSDLDFGDAFTWEVTSAQLSIDFGVSLLPSTDVLPFVTSSFTDDLSVGFDSPVSWDALFASTSPPTGVAPTQIVATFLVGVQQGAAIPEPPLVMLMLVGGMLLVSSRLRAKA